MPKIIENINDRLLAEAKRQIVQSGYAGTTVRSVATACGVGVGTVYNYFKSKDHLIATVMAADWQRLLDDVRTRSSTDAAAVLRHLYDALIAFAQRYHALFCDRDAVRVFATVFVERHSQLRHQLAALIRPLCDRAAVADADFLAEYIAESLLTWTMAGKGFDEQYAIIRLLLK